ncbi:MAG TPA: PfkB family carbohydrate kinase [Phycisphaerae bacterium]|nr:PfkB family carbohydrate kinase [Phycisphaerae bacterium]HRW51255.1 PfkB family carbohydrate kinase [Phycisphaerae bacterium]
MSLLVTGTIGVDTVETTQSRADNVLGGSAAYFACAASLIHPVRLVAAVGDDFPAEFRSVLESKNIDLTGLESRAGSKTFRWHGRYMEDMNDRESLQTDLNIVGEDPPVIPEGFRDSKIVFLANTHPAVQKQFVEQLAGPHLIFCDTMDLWINAFRDDLLATLRIVDGVVMNDSEAKMLMGGTDLIKCGRQLLDVGPKYVVIKKGEHGAMLITRDALVSLPVYPTEQVKDPTGAGDCFAGGMMAYLAKSGRTDLAALKMSLAYGACVASIAIEDFSMRSLQAADADTVESRMKQYREMLTLE